MWTYKAKKQGRIMPTVALQKIVFKTNDSALLFSYTFSIPF